MKALTVFISYSSRDIDEALTIRRILTTNGCTVWLDVFDIRVSQDLKTELGGGIGNAAIFCLLLSPTAVASPWVAHEIEKGLQEVNARKMRLIPIILRPCTLPDALNGLVCLDATKGIDAPTVTTRLLRSILGNKKISDAKIDLAFKKEMQEKEEEAEAMLQMPELAKKVAALADDPILELTISFNRHALPAGKILAVSFEFDRLFSQPMWFLFAHFAEGRTWPGWMKRTIELDHYDIPDDGMRMDGRFEWYDHVSVLECGGDGTDLRSLPASFSVKLDGKAWRPSGGMQTYAGGPSLIHMQQEMQIPGIQTLIKKDAQFYVSLLDIQTEQQEPVVQDENDLNVKILTTIQDKTVTLFNSSHDTIERSVLKGDFLSGIKTAIKREAVLGFYPKSKEINNKIYDEKRVEAHQLLNKSIDALSVVERRTAGALTYDIAKLEIFRCYNSAPPRGKARDELYERALQSCWKVCLLLGPIAQKDPRVEDVGMVFWANSNIAEFFRKLGDKENARKYSDMVTGFMSDIVKLDNTEPAYKRWLASAQVRYARILGDAQDLPGAMDLLVAAISSYNKMYEEVKNKARKDNLRENITEALKISAEWKKYRKQRAAWESLLQKSDT